MRMGLDTGITMAYDDRGDGASVVFVHGFPHNRSIWSRQVQALSSGLRCIAPDLRGFGETEAKPPFSIDQYADDVAALIRGMSLGRTVVLGLSMGGYVALSLFRRHRDVLRALILTDTRAGADDAQGKQKRNDMITLVREKGMPALADAQITGMLGKTTREAAPSVVAETHALLASAPAEGVTGALVAMRDRVDSTPLLADIDVPTLVIVGEEDALTPPKEARVLHEMIRGSRLEIIPAAGHLANVEQAGTFNRAVSAFMSSLQAG